MYELCDLQRVILILTEGLCPHSLQPHGEVDLVISSILLIRKLGLREVSQLV